MRLKITNISVLLGFLFFWSITNAQNPSESAYAKAVFETKKGKLPYRILTPKNLDSSKKYPLILFLHGSGERGNDNQLQLKHGASFFASDSIRSNYEAFVVFPQCDLEGKWTDYKLDGEGQERKVIFNVRNPRNKQQLLLEALLEYLIANQAIDPARLYIGGLSMGGMGTLDFIKNNPKTFAAAFAICGGTHLKAARKIKNTPLWLFHGEDDMVIPVKYSKQLYEVLTAMKAQAKLTLYPDTGHDSWTQTFTEPDLLPWLFSHAKKTD